MRCTKFRQLGLAALVTLCAGCAGGAPGLEREVVVPRYLFGAFGGTAVDLRDWCESGRAQTVRTTRESADYAVAVISLGIYVPHRLRIRCLEPSTP